MEIASLPEVFEYDWPGNIRQLKNVAERVAVLYREPVDLQRLARQALVGRAEGETPAGCAEGEAPASVCAASASAPPASAAILAAPSDLSAWIRADRVRREREEILLALRECGGRRDQAAGMLGISRSTLWRRMRECGIQGESQNSSISDT